MNLRWMVSPYRIVLAGVDALIAGIALLVSVVAYHNGQIPPAVWHDYQITALLSLALLIAGNILLGLYSRVWEFATAETAITIGIAVTGSQIVAAELSAILGHGLPISVWLTTWLIVLLSVGGVRFGWRFMRPLLERNGASPATDAKRLLIYGAGDHGHMLASRLRRGNDGVYEVVGFVDDDSGKQGLIVGADRVLGKGEDLDRLVTRHRVDEVILAMPAATRDQLRRAYELCRGAGASVKVLPPLLELIEEPQRQRLRQVNVEDLLGRELPLSDISLTDNYLAGKTVLITGAGGSIGSEISRQICRYQPKRVILVGRGENRIHWIYLYLRRRHPDIDVVPVVANIACESSARRLLKTVRPDIIIHAAAHKHVYLMEYVPVEAARNNVLATARLADLAEEHGVERFIFISTDKAVAPHNIMGATKRVGELLLTSRPHAGTAFICVRFGNVLGSDGSVLEIFKRQWERDEPLTITHPECTRYFMSIPEACFLVLQAGSLGRHGDIFILRMGEPLRIVDLAREFISLQGGNPDLPSALQVTGLRAGERLHEFLTNQDEVTTPTGCEHIDRIIANGERPPWPDMSQALAGLQRWVDEENDEEVCRALSELTAAELQVAQWK